MSTIQIKINTVDKSSLVDWSSVRKTEILTNQPDMLEFMIKNVPSKTYRPALGDAVQMVKDGTVIFGGVVIETSEKIEGLVKFFSVICKDYTETLDGTFVAKTYSNMTAAAIISDIITNFAPAGFTITHVVAPYVVDSISFNYLAISQCLQKLAEAIPGYDWYIDYAKDIHFFLTTSNSAPFGLDDTSGNFNYQSLIFDTKLSQLRNQIVVRGGDTLGTAVDNQQVADGKQRIFFVGYNLTTFLAYKALAASPTSFVALTVGSDGKDNPASFDALYNPDKGLLTFPDATKPAINDVVKYTGVPSFPLISIVQDSVSVNTYGVYEYLIVDKTITTKTQSQARAQAELLKYSQPLTTGSFDTITDGLQQGQVITINCPARGINGTYKIQQITTILRTPSQVTSDLFYTIQFVSTLDVGMVDLLNKLLIKDVSDQITIGANEIIDRVYALMETITLTETVIISKSHNPQNEIITLSENFVPTGKNFGTIFVAGPYVTTLGVDLKRQFVLNGSRLG